VVKQSVISMTPYQSHSTLVLLLIIGVLVVLAYREFELARAWRAYDRQVAEQEQADQNAFEPVEVANAAPHRAHATAGSSALAYDWRTQGL